MKKILATLVVLALVMPAMAADIDFDVVDNGDGSFSIVYVATTAPRGLALAIDTDTVDIADTSAASDWDVAFNCFMDYASVTPGYDLGDGHPLAAKDVAGEPACPTNEFSVCMGVLDEGGNQGAGPLGTTATPIVVATILTDLEAGECAHITIGEDAFRGGVVGDAALTTNLPIENYEICKAGAECMKNTHADYAEWVSVGSPECWCFQKQAYGDADGTSQGSLLSGYKPVFTNDLSIFLAAYGQTTLPDGGICADFDHAQQGSLLSGYKRVFTDDLAIFLEYYGDLEATVPASDSADFNFFTN